MSTRSTRTIRSDRKTMLEQVRKALGRGGSAAGQPERADSADPAAAARLRLDRLEPLGEVVTAIPPDQLIPRLEEELGKVSVHTHRASSPAELEKILDDILSSANAQAAVLSRNPLLARVGMESRVRASGKLVAVWPPPPSPPTTAAHEGLPSDMGLSTPMLHAGPSADPGMGSDRDAEEAFRHQCFSAEVGITGVDFALVESGTLVVTSLTEGSQLASLAPPVHVALYRREQVVATLEEVLDRLPGLAVSGDPAAPTGPKGGRSVVFITGTSRTADIEQILIRGVHGPREVHAILVEDTCLEAGNWKLETRDSKTRDD